MFVKIVFISPLDPEVPREKRKHITTLINTDMISSISFLEDHYDDWLIYTTKAFYELPKSENELFMTCINELVYTPDIKPVCEVVHYPELKVKSVLESVIKKGS